MKTGVWINEDHVEPSVYGHGYQAAGGVVMRSTLGLGCRVIMTVE